VALQAKINLVVNCASKLVVARGAIDPFRGFAATKRVEQDMLRLGVLGEVVVTKDALRHRNAREQVVSCAGGTLTGLRPTDFRTSYGLRRLVLRVRGVASLWSGLSLHHGARARFRCCPSSLYTSVRPERLARDCLVRGSPEFEQFCISGLPKSTQSLKSVASTVPPRRT
jgi:hypothetical protein